MKKAPVALLFAVFVFFFSEEAASFDLFRSLPVKILKAGIISGVVQTLSNNSRSSSTGNGQDTANVDVNGDFSADISFDSDFGTADSSGITTDDFVTSDIRSDSADTGFGSMGTGVTSGGDSSFGSSDFTSTSDFGASDLSTSIGDATVDSSQTVFSNFDAGAGDATFSSSVTSGFSDFSSSDVGSSDFTSGSDFSSGDFGSDTATTDFGSSSSGTGFTNTDSAFTNTGSDSNAASSSGTFDSGFGTSQTDGNNFDFQNTGDSFSSGNSNSGIYDSSFGSSNFGTAATGVLPLPDYTLPNTDRSSTHDSGFSVANPSTSLGFSNTGFSSSNFGDADTSSSSSDFGNSDASYTSSNFGDSGDSFSSANFGNPDVGFTSSDFLDSDSDFTSSDLGGTDTTFTSAVFDSTDASFTSSDSSPSNFGSSSSLSGNSNLEQQSSNVPTTDFRSEISDLTFGTGTEFGFDSTDTGYQTDTSLGSEPVYDSTFGSTNPSSSSSNTNAVPIFTDNNTPNSKYGLDDQMLSVQGATNIKGRLSTESAPLNFDNSRIEKARLISVFRNWQPTSLDYTRLMRSLHGRTSVQGDGVSNSDMRSFSGQGRRSHGKSTVTTGNRKARKDTQSSVGQSISRNSQIPRMLQSQTLKPRTISQNEQRMSLHTLSVARNPSQRPRLSEPIAIRPQQNIAIHRQQKVSNLRKPQSFEAAPNLQVNKNTAISHQGKVQLNDGRPLQFSQDINRANINSGNRGFKNVVAKNINGGQSPANHRRVGTNNRNQNEPRNTPKQNPTINTRNPSRNVDSRNSNVRNVALASRNSNIESRNMQIGLLNRNAELSRIQRPNVRT